MDTVLDPITDAIVRKMISRAEVGKKKYGTTVAERSDLSPVDWLTHFQEELMDGIVYAEKLKQDIDKNAKLRN